MAPLTAQMRRDILEGLAQDPSLKATQRLRALEELGRLDARKAAARSAPEDDDELPPDPMADLDEVEQQRKRRAARRRRAAG